MVGEVREREKVEEAEEGVDGVRGGETVGAAACRTGREGREDGRLRERMAVGRVQVVDWSSEEGRIVEDARVEGGVGGRKMLEAGKGSNLEGWDDGIRSLNS